ncbi:MAG: GNAT family N-acetyltransferase [Lachnospiraceae bacterium]|nr:GNAT family N-acetyltransferase [Lachnospiraceae bacterium]
MIIYKEFDISEMADVVPIYENIGWTMYLRDKDKLFSAFENSLYLLGAFDGEQMVGFARAVGDGEHIVLVQDLIVLSEYQNRGIGSGLFEKTMKKFANVRTFMIITDIEDKKNQVFYQKFGMKKLDEHAMVGYIR